MLELDTVSRLEDVGKEGLLGTLTILSSTEDEINGKIEGTLKGVSGNDILPSQALKVIPDPIIDEAVDDIKPKTNYFPDDRASISWISGIARTPEVVNSLNIDIYFCEKEKGIME